MDMSDMGSGGSMDENSGMVMYFNTDIPVTVAFKGWVITDTGLLTASCFGVAGLAIVFELLKMYREILWERYSRPSAHAKQVKSSVSPGGPLGKETTDLSSLKLRNPSTYFFWGMHFIHCLIYMVQVFLGYLLMLIVMTYNVWLFISIILALCVGYFLAHGLPWKRWMLPSDKISSCDVEFKEKGEDGKCRTQVKVISNDYMF